MGLEPLFVTTYVLLGLGCAAAFVSFLGYWLGRGETSLFGPSRKQKEEEEGARKGAFLGFLSRAADPLRWFTVSMALSLVVISQILIWSDSSGSGNMFTFQGVSELFKSKSTQWHVGIWTEVLCLQVSVALIALEDGRRLQLPALFVMIVIGVAVFLPAGSLGLHLVGRTAIALWRHYFPSKESGRKRIATSADAAEDSPREDESGSEQQTESIG
jgi:hypothetical protein